MNESKIQILALLCLAITFTSQETYAQRKYAIDINAGTTGIGGSAIVRINDKVNARVGLTAANYNRAGTYNDLEIGVDYDGTANISSFSILADIYPFKRIFKVTAGFYKMNWKVNALVFPNEGYEIEDRTFEPDRLGSLTADITYSKKISPYVGIGFGNAVAKGSLVKLNIDLGLIRSGAPSIDMNGTGIIAPTADNEGSFQTGLNEFEWYPVVRVGFSFAFIKVNQ